jgi:2,4-dienoyl-CoA reductase (NADPH2)
VGCARAFLIDSAFAEKIRNGVPYLKCIGCNKGCIEQILKHRPATCVFNPAVGKEEEGIPAAKVKKRVLVAGGGPAGLYTATYLARSGHEVTLCNRDEQWGGLLRYASLPPHKQAIAHNVDTMVYLARQAGVTLLESTEADEKFLEEHPFDFCVLAEGCRERIPKIEGDGSRRIYLAREIFEADRGLLESFAGKSICIVGGGSQAVELALYMFGKTAPDPDSSCFLDQFVSQSLRPTLETLGKITIVEVLGKIARDLGSTRWILMKQLERYPVELMTGSTVRKITPAGVEIQQGDEVVTRGADVIVLAVGYVPGDGKLTRCLEREKIPYVSVGDGAGQGKGVMSATQSAWQAAIALGGDGDG